MKTKNFFLGLTTVFLTLTAQSKENLPLPNSVFVGIDQITNQSCEVHFSKSLTTESAKKQKLTPVSIKIGDKTVNYRLSEHGVLFSDKYFYSMSREVNSPDPDSNSTYFLDREIIQVAYDPGSDSVNYLYNTVRFNLFYRDRSTYKKEKIIFSNCLDLKRIQ